LLPAVFGALGAERLFFAVADGADAVAGDAGAHECSFYGVSAVVAESQVVFGRAAFIAMAFDRETDSRMSG